MESRGVRRPSVCKLLHASRFFYLKHDWIATKVAHDGPQIGLHPGCAQGQGQGQRSRDTVAGRSGLAVTCLTAV